MKVPVVEKVLKANDQMAGEVRERLGRAGVTTVNLMASPGAGKTSVILSTLDRLPDGVRAGVVEGDLASSIDADRVAERGVPVVQINTGGSCHLDASMLRSALPHLPLEEIDLLFVENVGNLICPSSFDLGADLALVVGSVPEGDDKPYKYPSIFTGADAVVLNKTDLLDVFDFDVDYYRNGIGMVNAEIPVLPLSCRTGEGLDDWVGWMVERAGVAAGAAAGERPARAGSVTGAAGR